MDNIPPDPRGRGTNVLMLILLLLLVGGLLAWAFLKNPPGTARPSATGTPSTIPSGS